MSIFRIAFSTLITTLLAFAKAGPLHFSQSPATRSGNQDLTVSYSIGLKAKKGDAGIGETYNGGVKTIFISRGQARLRLVSLMRMQSVFILPGADPGQNVAILKESGGKKYKFYLSSGQWKQYNKKYEGVTCSITGDTATILHNVCKKAVITLTTGETITAWYSPAIQRSVLALAEPAFSCIPGLVLKYEFKYKKGTITYTATTLSTEPIDPDVFNVPEKGFLVQKYSPAP